MFIKYSDLPNNQDLFLDYMYDFEKVRNYYGKDFRDFDKYPEHFNAVIETERTTKNLLVSAIENQYKNFKPSKQTQSNIESLKSKKAVAVVTGQQLSIFGGPLYTFYKAATAVKLCSLLKEKFHTFQFVPVFWLEADDHDFDEIRSLNIISKENELTQLSYDDGKESEVNRGSIGKLIFDENINSLLNEFDKSIRDSDFKPELMKLMKSAYCQNKTFSEAFRRIMFDLFDDHGLVIFDPTDGEIRKLLKPIFKKEIEEFREHTGKIVERSAELDETYHAQVKVKPINLFINENDGRYLLEPVDEEYRLKGRRKKYTREQLVNLVEVSPERFSPNVLLRPICQDYLFPTGIYVGGPGEVSYFAQMMPLYEKFEIEQPIIYPRASATIMEKNTKNVMEKYEIVFTDFFLDDKTLTGKAISKLSHFDIEAIFESQTKEIQYSLDRLKESLFAVDKNLKDSAIKTEQRIQQSLEQLKGRAQKAEELRYEAALRQLSKSKQIIFPNDNFQERVLNFSYVVNKYGMDVLKWLFNELNITKFEHQIIEM